MSITDAALKTQIIAEVADVNGVLAANIDTIWSKYQKWSAVPNLQFLFAKREAVQAVLTALRTTALNKSIGDFHVDKSAQISAMERLSGDLGAQIVEWIKINTASLPAQVGQLATSQLEQPNGFQPPDPYSGATNANDPAYRGSPYGRRNF